MAVTHTLLASGSTSATSTGVNLVNISQSYNDLRIIITGYPDSNNAIWCKFNNSGTYNSVNSFYTPNNNPALYGGGYNDYDRGILYAGIPNWSTSTYQKPFIIDIPNYTSTTTNKSFFKRGGVATTSASNVVITGAGMNTSQTTNITSFYIGIDSPGTFTFSYWVYGIARA